MSEPTVARIRTFVRPKVGQATVIATRKALPSVPKQVSTVLAATLLSGILLCSGWTVRPVASSDSLRSAETVAQVLLLSEQTAELRLQTGPAGLLGCHTTIVLTPADVLLGPREGHRSAEAFVRLRQTLHAAQPPPRTS